MIMQFGGFWAICLQVVLFFSSFDQLPFVPKAKEYWQYYHSMEINLTKVTYDVVKCVTSL